MDQIVIYQAGGMHKKEYAGTIQHWQEYMRSEVPEHRLIRYHDPCRDRNVEGIEHLPFYAYSALDKWHAAKAHIIFANLEADNPGGHGSIFETALQEGTRPHGLRIIVNADSHKPVDLVSGDIRRYRQAIEWGAHPRKYFPTLEKGMMYLATLLARFRVPKDHKPVFILLLGDANFSFRMESALPNFDNNIVHYLRDHIYAFEDAFERAAALRFYAQCADIIAVDFNSLVKPNERWLRDMAFEIIGAAAIPQKLLTACAGVEIDSEMACRIPHVFGQTNEMVGYIKTALRQFGYPS